MQCTEDRREVCTTNIHATSLIPSFNKAHTSRLHKFRIEIEGKERLWKITQIRLEHTSNKMGINLRCELDCFACLVSMVKQEEADGEVGNERKTRCKRETEEPHNLYSNALKGEGHHIPASILFLISCSSLVLVEMRKRPSVWIAETEGNKIRDPDHVHSFKH